MTASPSSPAQNQALYRAMVDEAVAGGAALMAKLVAEAGKGFYARELTARSLYERDALIAAGKLLQSKEAELCAAYPKALLAAFTAPELVKKNAPQNIKEVHFDQLELMDEGQVQSSVAVARAQQVALLAVDVSLSELNTLMCGALGLRTVRLESNPLRPDAYVNALKQVVDQVQVPQAVRLDWLTSMSVTLGTELDILYRQWVQKLQAKGVVAAGYAMTYTPAGAGVGVPGSVSMDSHRESPMLSNIASIKPTQSVTDEDDTILTLDRLRRLLAGELNQQAPLNRVESFAQKFSRDFEGVQPDAPRFSVSSNSPSDFSSTVPAAFEALEEMNQVGQVVERLKQRQAMQGVVCVDGNSSFQGIRDMLRQSATGVGQALSLEVVTLMVDNMARNPRLLEPIQRLIAELEPALLLLSLVDPRFFIDKLHPARELLQEITHRSMAYESTMAPGFGGFLKELQDAVQPLTSAAIENADPFEKVLVGLRAAWELAAQARERDREHAVQALQHAEQRNLLAEKIARQIENHADSARVPEVVLDFLCGPWAQVVAQARITGGTGSRGADKYQALISAMLWSAHPDLARKNIAKLTKLVPLLLATVRDGLETIRYPATKTSAFLEALMGLHQLAFRWASKAASRAASKSAASEAQEPEQTPVLEDEALPRSAPVRVHVVEDGDPWVAPAEAQASNFMSFQDSAPSSLPSAVLENEAPVSFDDLPLGSWVEMLVNQQWVRTQLTWASPHGTLFLFTSVFGSSQSMTRRSRDKMVETGALRVVSGQPMVEGALDAVAQIALRNSMDSAL